MKKITFEICGKTWTLRIMGRKKYRKKRGADSVAVTDVNRRRVDIGPNGLDRETFIHELVHAYLGEFCTHSSDLDDQNLEEIFCELMSKRGEEIMALADKLLLEAKVPPPPLPVALLIEHY